MDYIDDIKNLRAALRLISERLPEVKQLIDRKKSRELDPDLTIMTMPDMEFRILEKGWQKVEEKLNFFDYEQEYGKVDTLSKSEMRGFQ